MRVTLKAKSSSGNPYDVSVSIDGGVTSIRCVCAAAGQNQLCKHVRAVYLNDSTMLHDDGQFPLLDAVAGALSETTFFERLGAYEAELNEIERQKRSLDARKKMLNATFARALREGVGESK